jgi:hypothetical protein
MRRGIVLTTIMLLWSMSAAAQFVAPGGTIPAVANTPGENNTFWRSDVSIVNLSSADTSVVLLLLPELRGSGPAFDAVVSDPMPIVGNGQLTLANVVTGTFGLRNVKGGLSVFSTDGAPVVLASRTYTNAATGGSYGLNVNGVLVADTAWIANVAENASYRTNIGVLLPIDPPTNQSLVFTVRIIGNDGVEVASGSLLYSQAGLQQKGLDFFGVEAPLQDGWAEVRCSDPTAIWYAYATVIDNVTGDSVYRAAITRQSSIP